jgi:hypothetical protein
VNGATGKVTWYFATRAPVDWSPSLADDMVVIGSSDGVMYSLEADTGQECWTLPLISPFSRAHPTFGTDGNLYFGGPGWMVALDHVTKVPSWLFTTPTTNNLTANIAPDGTVYFGSDDGLFYALWGLSLGGFGQSPWPASGQNARHTGLLTSAPKILNQPTSQTVQLGGAATLAAIAAGMPPLSFQWMLQGKPVGNATNLALILTNLQAPMLGDYSLRVTNQYGAVTSIPATLGLNLPPTIILQPQNLAVPAGGSAKFTVAATGASPLTYQWQLNRTNLTGATQPDLVLTNVTAANAGVYSAQVGNGAGTASSSNATLVVVMPAALTIQPYVQVSLTGTIGGIYRVESTHDLGSASWTLLTNLALLSNPTAFSIGTITNSGSTFYRAITTQ